MRYFALFVALAILTGCKDSHTPGTPNASTSSQSKRTYTRDEFKALVIGKTEAQVIEAVGKPTKTTDNGGKRWYFDSLTVDPVTRKTDSTAQVVFEGDTVEQVNFS